MDDLTFRVQFGGDGAGRLRDRVKEKLKEFMGDYTDDTLVEYVIVLLKNGRRKEEAKNELNVFLGDDSDSFVSWLWDHLQSNINLYVQPGKACQDEAAKLKSTSGDQGERTDSRPLDSEPEKEISNKISKRRHTKEWNGLVRDAHEPPPLRSAVIANIHRGEEGTNQSIEQAKRSLSPRPVTHRKRRRPGERPQRGEAVSKNGASRRLLQFAVRDAVAPSRPSSLNTEPSLKRLCSVVSTSTDDFSLKGRPQSVSCVPKAMAVAIKAVAEAAKDVVKVKHSGNVFDRLGRGMGVYNSVDHLPVYREPSIEYDGEYRGSAQVQEKIQSTFHQPPDKDEKFVKNMSMLESDAGVGSDFVSDKEDYDNVLVRGRKSMDISETGTSDLNKDDSLMVVQHKVANTVVETLRNRPYVQYQPAANTSSKLVNVSSKVNTLKPSHYQEPMGSDVENQKHVQEGEPGAGKSGVCLMKENGKPVAVTNGNAVIVDAQRESQKTIPSAGTCATGRPTEDADSRTVFVSNVHFAATKDSLSRHFNKFGEVLKVVIVTDAATGQPKGSAYVEFMRTEAAEHALSLDGASFMSRILKVVRKSSAQQEASPAVIWPRVSRGSPFGGSRFVRGVSYPRGMSSIYGPRFPIRAGARSLQWKRGDASENSALASTTSPVPSPTSRSLTYIRTLPKTNGDSDPA